MGVAKEVVTPEERLWAAIGLEKSDRVPIVPLLTSDPAAYLTGMTMAQVNNDNQMALTAFFKVFDDYGGWDSAFGCAYTAIQMQAAIGFPMKIRIPGKDLPDDYVFQVVEEEVLKPEDYDKICQMGIDRFYYQDYLWRVTDLKAQDLPKVFEDLQASYAQFVMECNKRGTPLFYQAGDYHPFFRLSLMRSMVPFTEDLYFNPEPVEKALKQMTAELIPKQLRIAKASGINRWFFVDERASGFFYPTSVFERFWWPYTVEIVDAFWSEGIVTIFHLDQCWDKNIEYFSKLPKGSAIIELDSTTDIFRAKEILRGHLCLLGDVSATLLSIGKPEEVEAYCKKLIDEVGVDGGFILSSGCAVPANVKPENFRIMIETGKNYQLSKR